MEAIIKYAYTGAIFWNEVDNLLDLIKVADYLDVNNLKEEAIKTLKSNLSPSDAIDAYHLSCIFNDISLKEISKDIILQNFEVVSETDKFLSLDFVPLKDILSNNSLIFWSEKILQGVLRWIVQDLELRKLYLMDIFGLIQFGHADFDVVLRNATDKNILTESVQHK